MPIKIPDNALKPIEVYTLNTGIELRKRNRPITEDKSPEIKPQLKGNIKKQKTEETLKTDEKVKNIKNI